MTVKLRPPLSKADMVAVASKVVIVSNNFFIKCKR